MKHRIFTLLLAVCMLLCALPVSADETTEPPAGQVTEAPATEPEATTEEATEPTKAPNYCGDAILWAFSDGTLTLTGTGKMDDFPNGAPWAEHKDQIRTVIISGGITYIGAYSFSDYDKLTDVQFGKDVKEIGERAFFSCDGLTKVSLPASFKVFGPASFMGCSKLKEFHCAGVFPSFRQNCLWDTYAVIYFPASRPWSLKYIKELEEAFHGRIEFLASDGSDPYEPTEAPKETERPTEEPTTEPVTEATTEPVTDPTTEPPTSEGATVEMTDLPGMEPENGHGGNGGGSKGPGRQDRTETEGRSTVGLILLIVLLVGAVAVFLILGKQVFTAGNKDRYYR